MAEGVSVKILWTNYYGNWRAIPPGWTHVQASNTAPHWWQPDHKAFAPDLAPVWMRLVWAGKVQIDDPRWVAHYTAQLDALHRSGKLAQIVDCLPENAVLYCWEKDWNECHRKVLAEYLAAKGLAQVTEYPSQRPVPPAKPKPMWDQLSLL